MRILLKNSCLLLLACWLTTGCMEQTIYHTYHSIPKKGWSKGDTLLFHIPITDSLPMQLEMAAEVRTRKIYPYQNLHLVVSHNLQDSTIFEVDTLTLALTDQKDNRKRDGWSSLLQSTLRVNRVIPKQPGFYTVRISHGMTDELLPGIHDVGVFLRHSNAPTPTSIDSQKDN